MLTSVRRARALSLRADRPLVRAAEFVSVAVLYFALAKASLAFASINPSATPIWPPTGLALGLVLLRGQRILPAIFLGAFAANVATTGTFLTSAAIGLGNTLEALVGAFLLNRWAGGRNAFRTPYGIAKFALIVAAASTPTSATIGVLTLAAAGHAAWSDFFPIWATWWLGDLAGAVTVAPPLVLWARALQLPRTARGIGLEAILVLLFSAVVGAIAFSPLFPLTSDRHTLAFLAILPLLWAALRRTRQETATVALVLSGFAIWGVAAGTGPFIQPTLNASFLLLISFIVSVTLPSLALSAAVASRDQALHRKEDDYRQLVESVRDYAIFMLDADGHVTTWNAGAARIKQYQTAEILGRHFSCFYTDEDRARNEPERALARAAKLGRDESEGWRMRKDGSRFLANAVINAVRDARGELIGYAKVTRDITEAREALAALEKTREQLLQAQKLEAVGQLTGGVAHDFNNLLMVISGGVRALERDADPERRAKILDEMRHVLERGAGLTRQLLAFARGETLRPEVIDIAERISGMQALLGSSLRANIGIELSFPPDLWPISVDPGQLELAILNLAVNARDAMPEGGMLTISAENLSASTVGDKVGDYVRIRVGDTGAGMPPEVRARAFEPFYSTKRPGQGTGLGLSQVYGFATQSGGAAQIESGTGQGTAVTLVLPRARHSAVPRPAPQQAAEGAAGTGAVLVVEDDDGVAGVVCEMIAQLGYQATRVASGQAALRALEQKRGFDLVFSDIVMPGMSGVELAKDIRRRQPDMPIVLTTGYSGGATNGSEEFQIVRKPYEPKELSMAFRAALATRPRAVA